jgi:hypothetical protein
MNEVTMHRMLCLSTLLVCACGGSSGLTLATVTQTRLFVVPASLSLRQDDAFHFVLDHSKEDGCLVLSSSARATVNGADAPVFFRGELVTETIPIFSDDPGTDCHLPSFIIPVDSAQDEETTIALEDGDTRFAAVVRNLGATPTVTVTPPANGRVRAGSTLSLSWTPASDDISHMNGWLFPQPPPGTATQAKEIDATAFQQGYTIPAEAPPGPALLQFSGTRTPEVIRCEGVTRCDLSYSLTTIGTALAPLRAAEVQINIEP